ncbi:MAG TPA: hypothetical protein VMH30_10475 [Verrucomicrobiae bacterium]|nr:hypothetical protein [Verrucomicrobiae bacterium]
MLNSCAPVSGRKISRNISGGIGSGREFDRQDVGLFDDGRLAEIQTLESNGATVVYLP